MSYQTVAAGLREEIKEAEAPSFEELGDELQGRVKKAVPEFTIQQGLGMIDLYLRYVASSSITPSFGPWDKGYIPAYTSLIPVQDKAT